MRFLRCTGIIITLIIAISLLFSAFPVYAQQSSLNVLEDRVRVEMSQGETGKQAQFDVKNTGDTDIDIDFDVSSLDLTDGEGDEISVSFSDPGIIAPDETQTITMTLDSDSLIDFEEFGGRIRVFDTLSDAEDTFNLEIFVQPDVCDFGQTGGDLELSIKDPDVGEDFEVGDEVTINAKVSNVGRNDIRVQVEALLFSESVFIESASSETMNLEDDDEETFDLKLKIPTESTQIDEDDTFTIFIKAFDDENEQLNCIQKGIDIDIDLQRNKVIIDDAASRISPTVLACGEEAVANIVLTNVGKRDSTGAIRITNSALGISEESDSFLIESFNSRDGNIGSRRISIVIPDDADEGVYLLRVESDFSGSTDSTDFEIEVVNCGAPISRPATETDAFIRSSAPETVAAAGSFVSVPLEITNNRHTTATYTLSFRNFDDFSEIPASSPITLGPGQSTTFFLDLVMKENVEPGSYSGVVEVKEGITTVAADSIVVSIAPKSPPTITEFFAALPLGFWIIVNIIILVIVLLAFSVLITSFKKYRKSAYKTAHRARR